MRSNTICRPKDARNYTFWALKVTYQVATLRAESAVYDCLVMRLYLCACVSVHEHIPGTTRLPVFVHMAVALAVLRYVVHFRYYGLRRHISTHWGMWRHVDTAAANVVVTVTLLFCSSAVLDARVGHTMDVLSPFIPVLCHSD